MTNQIKLKDRLEIFRGFDEGWRKEILDEYIDRAKKFGPNAERILSGVVKPTIYGPRMCGGSNPYSCVLLGDIIRPYGLKIPSLSDIVRVTQEKAKSVPRTGGPEKDKDCAILLGSYQDDFIYRDLITQLGRKHKSPILLNLADLTLRSERNAPYELAFTLRDSARPIDAQILQIAYDEKKIGFISEDIDLNSGLPKTVRSIDDCIVKLECKRSGNSASICPVRRIQFDVNYPLDGMLRLKAKEGAWGGNFIGIGAKYSNYEDSLFGVPNFVYTNDFWDAIAITEDND